MLQLVAKIFNEAMNCGTLVLDATTLPTEFPSLTDAIYCLIRALKLHLFLEIWDLCGRPKFISPCQDFN